MNLSAHTATGPVPIDGAAIRRVLIADDEPDLSASVAWRLEQAGYHVTGVSDGPATLAAIQEDPPDLVLLDLVLPGLGGLDVLRQIRQWSDSLPVILISGRSDETDRVVGLEIGADDFVLKPFSPRELVARIGSVLRRSSRATSPDRVSRFGNLMIDRSAHQVRLSDEEVHLSSKEYRLLETLLDSPNIVFSRQQLIEAVWPESSAENPDATLTEHVSRLRRKLEVDPATPVLLRTVRGVGYRFSPA